MQIGYRIKEKIHSENVIISLILITIGGLCRYLNGEVNLRETIYANPFLFWIASVSACYGILILVRNMYDYCKKVFLF